ncbi:MAG: DUF5655 domain-containing protein [Longimicrobiales bacterium]
MQSALRERESDAFLWHVSVDDFLVPHAEPERALFRRFVDLVRSCGPVLLAPASTRVGFQVRMIFASVNRLAPGRLDAHVVLARRLENARFHKIESISRRNHVHHFRISSLEQLDSEVVGWLREAYQVGEQKHLES